MTTRPHPLRPPRAGRLSRAALALCLPLWMAGCASDRERADPSPPPAPPIAMPPVPLAAGAPLRVGIAPGIPPFAFVERGAYAGLEPELAAAVGVEFGRAVELVELTTAGIVPALLEDRVDLAMAGAAITPDLRKQVMLCPAYLRVGHGVLIRQADRRLYRTANDVIFTPRRTATLEGGAAEAFARAELRFSEHFHVDSADQGAEALLRQDIDLFAADAPTVRFLAARHAEDGLVALPFVFGRHPLAWAVQPGNEPMRNAVAAALERIMRDGRLDAMLDRWLPARE